MTDKIELVSDKTPETVNKPVYYSDGEMSREIEETVNLEPKYRLNDIPPEIIEAARKLEIFFADQNIKDWKLCGVQNREYPQPVSAALEALKWLNSHLKKNPTIERLGSPCEIAATQKAIDTIKQALAQSGGQVPVEYLCKDDQEQAVWQAIQDIKFGNKTDDKMIVARLHKAGFYIARQS